MTRTRSSNAERMAVCQPPPDNPVIATRSLVGVRVCQEHVEGPLHDQVEHADARRAAQVERADAIVIEIGAQFAHAYKFAVERQHAALGQVDASRLLVVHRLAAHVVAVGVEHGRYATADLRWFIKQSGYPHPRIAFVAQFANAISRVRFDRINPLDPRHFVEQAVGVAAEK